MGRWPDGRACRRSTISTLSTEVSAESRPPITFTRPFPAAVTAGSCTGAGRLPARCTATRCEVCGRCGDADGGAWLVVELAPPPPPAHVAAARRRAAAPVRCTSEWLAVCTWTVPERRQAQPDVRAAIGPVGGVRRAAVGAGYGLDDREPEPAAARAARRVGAAETLEGMRQVWGRKTIAAIDDVQLPPPAGAPCRQLDRRPAVAHRVVDEVVQRLTDARRVGIDLQHRIGVS